MVTPLFHICATAKPSKDNGSSEFDQSAIDLTFLLLYSNTVLARLYAPLE